LRGFRLEKPGSAMSSPPAVVAARTAERSFQL
jgi:hypothetical protein